MLDNSKIVKSDAENFMDKDDFLNHLCCSVVRKSWSGSSGCPRGERVGNLLYSGITFWACLTNTHILRSKIIILLLLSYSSQRTARTLFTKLYFYIVFGVCSVRSKFLKGTNSSVLRIRITLMRIRIRILLVTFIRILPFTLLRIRFRTLASK